MASAIRTLVHSRYRLMFAVAIVGVLAVGAATGTVLGTQSGSPQAGSSSDVAPQAALPRRMPALDQQLAILADTGAAPQLLESAINQVVRLNLGPPIILPTASDIDDTLVIGETQRFFNRALQNLDDSRLALTNLKTNATAQDDTRAAAERDQRTAGSGAERDRGTGV